MQLVSAVAELPQKQKQLKNEADSCQSKDKRREINKNRNNVMKEIRKRVRYNEYKKLDKQLIQIEAYKDDSNKCYQAIRILNSKETPHCTWERYDVCRVAGMKSNKPT